MLTHGKDYIMNEWITKAQDLILLALGNGHSPVERVIIAICVISVFFLILKSFSRAEGGGNAAWIRRFIAAVLILLSILLGAVAADILVSPYVTSDMIQNIILVLIPSLILAVIATPLLMLVLKKDYGGALVTVISAVIASVITLFAVSFIVDSLDGSNKEFKRVKKRTNVIDEFIND